VKSTHKEEKYRTGKALFWKYLLAAVARKRFLNREGAENIKYSTALYCWVYSTALYWCLCAHPTGLYQ